MNESTDMHNSNANKICNAIKFVYSRGIVNILPDVVLQKIFGKQKWALRVVL